MKDIAMTRSKLAIIAAIVFAIGALTLIFRPHAEPDDHAHGHEEAEREAPEGTLVLSDEQIRRAG